MYKVVSVSLGSPDGDFQVIREFLGQQIAIRRMGVNGNLRWAREAIQALDNDPEVLAISLGGIDRWVRLQDRDYEIRDGRWLARSARYTEVVDGSRLKDTLERHAVQWINQRVLPLRNTPTLLVCAVDRFGMAEALVEKGADVIFGDLAFALGVNTPIRTLRRLQILGRLTLPITTQLPFKWMYPTGKKQRVRKAHTFREKYYEWATLICGDSHYINRFLGEDLCGKIILTNTLKQSQLEEMQKRGVRKVITTTQNYDGRSFGTNVMEGVVVTLLKTNNLPVTQESILSVQKQLKWTPTIVYQNP